MTKIVSLFLLALIVSEAAGDPPQWVKTPELRFDEPTKTWHAAFELTAPTDVEVAIVDPATKRVVRHLAAGVLGPKAPPPLAADSLAQKIAWDGKDDYGAPAADPAKLAVRVRAGMRAKLDRIAGGDPYAYFSAEMRHFDHSPFGIHGLFAHPDGSVYVWGHSSNLGPPALRRYDIRGTYQQTLFPPPAGKPVDAMRGWGINVRPDGTYVPKFTRLTDPTLTTTFLDRSTGGMARLFPHPDKHRLYFWNTGNTGNDADAGAFELMAIGTDGTISETAEERLHGPLVKSPPMPAGPVAPNSQNRRTLAGPAFTAFSADGKSFYLSGAYEVVQRYGSILEVAGKGFWRDGQVWKVDLETRAAEPFFALAESEIPLGAKERDAAIGPNNKSFAALHGVAVDGDENVFVCDRLHKCVRVLDRRGKELRRISVEHPDAVAVSARTGALYVTTRFGNWGRAGHVELLKFDDWRKDSEPAFRETVSSAGYAGAYCSSHLAICETPEASFVWAAYAEAPVRVYRDDKQGTRLLKDFYRVEGAQACLGFDRIAVDANTEEAYVLDDHSGVWKIGDWERPRFDKVPVNTASIAIDARQRHFYAHLGGGHSKKGIARFHLDDDYSPAPPAKDSGHELTPRIYSEWCFTGNGDLGFAVAPNGNLAALDQRGQLLFFRGEPGAVPWSPKTLATLKNRVGCVRFDLAGNLYVGHIDQSPAPLAGFEGDRFQAGIGRIHKYAPTGTLASGNLFPTEPVRPERSFDVPFGAFDADCIIRSPRFDVDGFGRIYCPTNIASRVTVVDGAGNEILRFGTYGNRDSTGGLPGDLVPTKDIPLGFPNSVAATDNYLYVGDMVNHRLLRIKKDFQLEATSR